MKTEKNVRDTFPGLKIVGRYVGYYPKQDEDDIVQAIFKSQPSLVLVSDGIKDKNVSQKYRCLNCGGGLIRRNGKNGFWWGCENYPKCKTSYPDSNGKPDFNR